MRPLDAAMVLAAGLGTRMRPLTNDRPKPLIKVSGRALIDHTLERLVEINIAKAVVNLHYFPEMMQAHLSGYTAPQVVFADERAELLETGGGVVNALPQLGANPFVVINSDNIWLGQNALCPLIDAWQPDKMDALLLLVPVEQTVGYTRNGDFSLASDQRLVRPGTEASAPFVFTGAQILNPSVFKGAPQGAFSLNIIWDQIIAAGRGYGVVHHGGWCDVGTPDGIKLSEAASSAM